jgi:NADH dehydrogenase
MSPDNLRSMEVPSVTDGTHNYPGWQPMPLESVAPTYLSTVKPKMRLDSYRFRAGR